MTQPAPSEPHTDHDEEGYQGPATLTVDAVDYDVTVTLLGHLEPFDGYFHWYGRVASHPGLHAALAGAKRSAHVRTPEGEADGEIADVDPWGRYRLSGVSTPPFAVDG